MPQSVAVVQMYGIGNAILTTPTIKALAEAGFEVDVVLDETRGTKPIFESMPEVRSVFNRGSKRACNHAIFCHPSKSYTNCCKVLERRFEPTFKPPKGRDNYMWAWTEHEAMHLLGFARELGYEGQPPPLFCPLPSSPNVLVGEKAVAIGIGYLKTHKYWRKKHWGNRNYATVCRKLIEKGYLPVLLGGPGDEEDALAINRYVGGVVNLAGRLPLLESFGVINQCVGYIGNDTGLMHAAAACRIPTLGIFTMTNPVKNRPWGPPGVWDERLGVVERPEVEGVIRAFEELL